MAKVYESKYGPKGGASLWQLLTESEEDRPGRQERAPTDTQRAAPSISDRLARPARPYIAGLIDTVGARSARDTRMNVGSGRGPSLLEGLGLTTARGPGGVVDMPAESAPSEVERLLRAELEMQTEHTATARDDQMGLIRQNQTMVDANQAFREEKADDKAADEWLNEKAQWQAKIADSRFRAPIKAAEDFKVAISDELDRIIAENEGDIDTQTRAYIEFISLAQRADNHLAGLLAQRDALAVEGLEGNDEEMVAARAAQLQEYEDRVDSLIDSLGTEVTAGTGRGARASGAPIVISTLDQVMNEQGLAAEDNEDLAEMSPEERVAALLPEGSLDSIRQILDGRLEAIVSVARNKEALRIQASAPIGDAYVQSVLLNPEGWLMAMSPQEQEAELGKVRMVLNAWDSAILSQFVNVRRPSTFEMLAKGSRDDG